MIDNKLTDWDLAAFNVPAASCVRLAFSSFLATASAWGRRSEALDGDSSRWVRGDPGEPGIAGFGRLDQQALDLAGAALPRVPRCPILCNAAPR